MHHHDQHIPLVLRRVPAERQHLARCMTCHVAAVAGDTWWELADTAIPEQQPPAAVALTRNGADGIVHLVTLSVTDPGDRGSHALVLRELIATLRRSGARAISVRAAPGPVTQALRALDFVQLGGHDTSGLFVLTL